MRLLSYAKKKQETPKKDVSYWYNIPTIFFFRLKSKNSEFNVIREWNREIV